MEEHKEANFDNIDKLICFKCQDGTTGYDSYAYYNIKTNDLLCDFCYDELDIKDGYIPILKSH
jgi:hypothetical protein